MKYQTARRQTKMITILAVTVRESGISEINNVQKL